MLLNTQGGRHENLSISISNASFISTAIAQNVPTYDVYVMMVSMYSNGSGTFRFAEEPTKEITDKNLEDAPMNCVYVKGPTWI